MKTGLRLAVLLAAFLISSSIPAQSAPKSNNKESVGLVLSGGGAKGIAHVGVIKALEDNDIPIDYVTGTSMGSIVGSLYSCGWSPEEMMNLFTSKSFLDWSRGVINKKYIWYYYKPDPMPQWVSVNISFKKQKETSIPNQIIPNSLISPLPMNIEFLKLFAPYTEQCDENFNNLFVPFRCVASDVYHKKKVVFSHGSLGDAVRASMSFPMVYRPIEVNGELLYDGGIYDNFPVNVMQEDFHPDFIIGVSVAGADKKPEPDDMYGQLEDMIIQNNDYSVPAKNGVKIQVPVLDFSVLDFAEAQTIYDIGYKTGLSMVDSIKSRVSSREPLADVTARREAFASRTPAVTFDSLKITGVKGSPERYLRYLFMGNQRNGTIDMDQTVTAYYRAVTDGSLRNLLPQAEFGRDGHNTLLLEASPKRPWTFSIGGYLTTSANSMLYFSGAYHTLGLNSLDVMLSAWVGQSYFAGMLQTRFALRTHVPSYLELTGVLSKNKFYENEVLFFKTSNPLFVTEIDNYLRAGYVWAIGRKMKGYASLAGGYMSNSYYPVEELSADRMDLIQFGIGAVRVGVEANDLDNQMFPSLGLHWYVNANATLTRSRFKPGGETTDGGGWKTKPTAMLEALYNQFFGVSKNWSIGVFANGGMTLQKLDQNYTNTLMHAPAFAPTPSTLNYFNLAFRSDNWVAAGFIPIWKPFRNMQVRGDFYAYLPVRSLVDTGRFNTARYEGWFRPVRFLGELAVVYNFPFASVSVYGNYLSSPARNWNFGISLGLLFKAPGLLR